MTENKPRAPKEGERVYLTGAAYIVIKVDPDRRLADLRLVGTDHVQPDMPWEKFTIASDEPKKGFAGFF